jgi:hypothetical protein
MINFNTEYYSNNYYFFLKERADKISLYYSIADTLTESRKNDERIDFDKKDSKKVKNIVGNVLKSKTKVSKDALTKKLKSIKPKKEIDELVDSDGTMLSSKMPFLNQTLTPHKTTDQTVAMSRVTNDPVTRGYRVYWGESEDEQDNVVSEVDYSDAFGYEETENMDFKNTVKTLKDMGVDNPKHRAKEFGKLPKAKRKGGKLKQRLSEKTIEEQQKDMMSSLLEKIVSENSNIDEEQKRAMEKMVEDILSKRDRNDSDVVSKNSGLNKILLKNIKSIKKLAEKECISINQLIKALKTNE